MVAEAANSALRRAAPTLEGVTAAVEAATLKVFDRYPVPAALGVETWGAAREALVVRLAASETSRPQSVPSISPGRTNSPTLT